MKKRFLNTSFLTLFLVYLPFIYASNSSTPKNNSTTKASNRACRQIWTQKNDLKELMKFMSQNGTFAQGQEGFFELYLINAFAKQYNYLESYLPAIKKIGDYLKKHSNLYKPLVREQEITFFSSTKKPESLKKFTQSFKSTMSQTLSKLFQVPSHWGFWANMLSFESSPHATGNKKQQFFEYLETTPLNKKTLKNLKYQQIEDQILNLYNILNQLRENFIKEGKNPIKISRAMVDLIHSSGFHNESFRESLKSPSTQDNLLAISYILEVRDTYAKKLGFSEGFSELEQALLKEQNRTNAYTKELENISKDIRNQKNQGPSSTLRLRALSLQESPFRGCLGKDCSTGIYFDIGLDPSFLYWTLTNRHHVSFGQITVVLGHATNNKGQKVKTAFVDKIQNVSIDKIIPMLEGIRLSLEELGGYKLALPKDVGNTDGLSGDFLTSQYVKTQILAGLKKPLKKFKPIPRKYNFDIGHSRAYEELPLLEFEPIESSMDFMIRPGEIYPPKQWDKNKKDLYHSIVSLKDSLKEEEQLKYLTNLPGLMTLKSSELNYDLLSYLIDRIQAPETYSFAVRKKAFFILIPLYLKERTKPVVDIELFISWLDNFSVKERQNLIGEMSNWKKVVIENYKSLFILHLSEKTLFTNNISWLKYILQYSFTPVLNLNTMRDTVHEHRETETPLMWFAKNGNISAIRLFLEQGANIEARNYEEQTALISATTDGSEGAIEELLNQGADTEAKDESGKTALIWASVLGYKGAIELLLKYGANIEAKDDGGQTPLIGVVNNIYGEEGLKVLINAGANIEARDDEGKTALIHAIDLGDENFIKILLKAGANTKVKDNEGRSIWDWISMQSQKQQLEKLFILL